MITAQSMPLTAQADSALVVASLSGNRDAFGQIVSRYQSLICSLAYSATGSLGQSEDLAQETFITAWTHLRRLREQDKLRAWLCGIARNRINNCLRREGREPVREAETLEIAAEMPSSEPLPHDQTISNEEQAILWRSLERIPALYREPLVLFYREHQSIGNVAAALELGEDAVKQRLARGRRLLAEEVTAIVEGALQRSTPGKGFTLAVLASLPVLTTSATAATVGAAAVKSGTMAKGAAAVGMFNTILGPVLGLVGPWLQYRVFLAAAKTDEERRTIRSFYRRLFTYIAGFGLLLVALIVFGQSLVHTHPLWFVGALIGLVAGYVAGAVRMGIWANTMFRKLHRDQMAESPSHLAQPIWEYRTRMEMLGLPLIHFRFHHSAESRMPVKAWIAGGDFAFGVLFAFGRLAVAPFSIGGVAIGIMSWGGLAVGLLALGGFALGGWVFGGFAVGWQAFGGCALGWNAAMGGLAVAREFALGGAAHAAQANTEVAAQFIKGSFFFQKMEALSRHIGWFNLLWLLPVMGWWKVFPRRQKEMPGS